MLRRLAEAGIIAIRSGRGLTIVDAGGLRARAEMTLQ